MPATVPPEIANALTNGEPAPAGLSADEKVAYEGMADLYANGSGYALIMVTNPLPCRKSELDGCRAVLRNAR